MLGLPKEFDEMAYYALKTNLFLDNVLTYELIDA